MVPAAFRAFGFGFRVRRVERGGSRLELQESLFGLKDTEGPLNR